MFQFGGFPSVTYGFSYGSVVLHHGGFPIRTSAGQSLFPARRGFSQVITSFFGSRCQGIHLMLFFAWTASLALFSLPLRNFKLFKFASCLSFANNCCLGCVEKTVSFETSFPTLLFPPPDTLVSDSDLVVCSHFFGKTFDISLIFLYTTICSFLLFYSVFNEHLPLYHICDTGGLKWTRTTDLPLIRRVL